MEDREWAVQIVKEQAVDYMKDTSISYSTSIQKADVISAYTLKADGRRIDVPKANFQVETNGGKGDGGPAFSDRTTMTVVFPELAVNDTVVFAYRLTGSQPVFERHFSTVENFNPSTYYGDVRMKIDAPETMPARYEAWQLKEARNAVANGRRVIEWTWQNRAPMESTRKDWSVYELGQAPGLAYSTFPDYASIADAYGARALPKAAVTPRIQKLADEVAAGRTGTREIAHALYDWVATEISYAGNCIGLGAVVPRDTDFVLDNRMGDCKDHATLLQAMLAAKGIRSQQALINAGNSYGLPKIPVVSMVNHVITYIPELDMYLDSTSSDTPFGSVPPSSAGKPVLLVDGYRDGSRTPPMPVGRNRQVQSTHLKVLADGSVEGDMTVKLAGMYGAASRAGLREVTEQQRQEMVKNYFERSGHEGSGSIEWDDAKALADSHRYSAKFQVKELLPVPGAFQVDAPFFSAGGVARFAAGGADEVDPDFPSACTSGYAEEEFTYEFAPELKVLAVPSNLKLANDLISYEASYELDGNRLKVRRVIDDRTPGPTCAPAVNAANQALLKKVLSNLKSQVVYGTN
ncbi:DUF3857 domain-containing transglutaminase family protein [Agrilutibacter solisilvae]|uniref:DUF3857 domain-containing transglutaminase family protein n=1 Tax=Agrilutibacter solisilvae TaxID=2763317 RepID=A0A975AR44_9GAMM|nr:DUF3857 domain-containing transglutaminase family protein [Lysobacter solisilvae]QSX77539.1 DUF3857 domain-containing transglutaminase family protein [Lysobacter solisilvae]